MEEKEQIEIPIPKVGEEDIVDHARIRCLRDTKARFFMGDQNVMKYLRKMDSREVCFYLFLHIPCSMNEFGLCDYSSRIIKKFTGLNNVTLARVRDSLSNDFKRWGNMPPIKYKKKTDKYNNESYIYQLCATDPQDITLTIRRKSEGKGKTEIENSDGIPHSILKKHGLTTKYVKDGFLDEVEQSEFFRKLAADKEVESGGYIDIIKEKVRTGQLRFSHKTKSAV